MVDTANTHNADEGEDVIDVLLRQHRRIESLLDEVRSTKGETRQEAFDELRSLLAAHETAEEVVVRPAVVETGAGEEADARNEEEAQATRTLAQLEELDVHSVEFEQIFAGFAEDVRHHAAQEEELEFPALRAGCDADRLRSLRKRVERLEQFGPTRPHPKAAGSPRAQALTGPFAAMVDRARDALTSTP